MKIQSLLGLPVSEARRRLEEKGLVYKLIKTEEPKKSLDGSDERVVRVKDQGDFLELLTSKFRTEQAE